MCHLNYGISTRARIVLTHILLSCHLYKIRCNYIYIFVDSGKPSVTSLGSMNKLLQHDRGSLKMIRGPGRRTSNDAWKTGRKLECCFSSPVIMKVWKIFCKISHYLKDTHQLATEGAHKSRIHTAMGPACPQVFLCLG